jgi:hypothetical protein
MRRPFPLGVLPALLAKMGHIILRRSYSISAGVNVDVADARATAVAVPVPHLTGS